MIIERLSRDHRNTEMLLAVLERELEVFDRGGRPDYEVIRGIISYFEVYPEVYHHPQEDLVFAKLKLRDPAAAAKVGDLAGEQQKGVERLRRVAQAVDGVLADREILRQNVDRIINRDLHCARDGLFFRLLAGDLISFASGTQSGLSRSPSRACSA
jgi:hemerythrin-like domain-containing protein